MTTLEERVSQLEGAYEHTATEADLIALRGEFNMMLFHVEGLSKAVRGMQSRLDDIIARPRRRMGYNPTETQE